MYEHRVTYNKVCYKGTVLYFSEPGPVVVQLDSCSFQLNMKFQLFIKTKIPTNKEVSCCKSLRCCIYHANEC